MRADDRRGLWVYFGVLAAVCGPFTWAALALGATANLAAAAYMITPAVAATIARGFFHGARFRDAALRPGPLGLYAWVWLAGVGLVLVQFCAFLASGVVSLELTGQGFLEQIDRAMPGGSAKLLEQLPQGMTLPGMLALYTLGGLTVFNVPGVLLGFGEEFGWRGYLFPALYRLGPRIAFVGGGLIWYAWHLPLALLGPRPEELRWLVAVHALVLACGAVATFVLFAWLFVRGGSVWVPSFFHAVMNNASRALSYWVRVEHQLAADAVLTLVMVAAVVVLWRGGRFADFDAWATRQRGVS